MIPPVVMRLALTAAVFLLSGTALAQEEDDFSFEGDAFVIKGKVQKPEVLVEIDRENLEKGFQLDLKESFLHKVVEALSKPPF